MKKYWIILITALVAGLGSCYKDKGNYDYTEINEISISGLEESYALATGVDTLHLEPVIEMTENSNEPDRFRYYWILYRGTSILDTLGTDRNLDYAVTEAPDTYELFLRVVDQKTTVAWKTSTTLNIGSLYSRGLMLMGTDDVGNAEAEMITMVRDTVHVKGLLSNSGLPALQDPVSMMPTGASAANRRIWVLTESGSYYLDRLTMKATPRNNFGSITYLTDNLDKEQLHPVAIAPQIRTITGTTSSSFVSSVVCSDGNLFACHSFLNGGDFYTNPVNRTAANPETRLKAAPFLLYSIGSMNSTVWYDTENDRFMNYSDFGLSLNSRELADNGGDPFPWNQVPTGRKLVYAENTRNTDGGSTQGNSFAIVRNNANESFIYKFYANGGSPAKRDAYAVLPIALDFHNADFYAFSSRRTVVFYSVGNKLYAYDYNKGFEKFYSFPEITDEISMLKFDTQIDFNTNSLYIATYNASSKGRLRRFNVGSNPDIVEITPVENADWQGLIKVKDVNWRAVN